MANRLAALLLVALLLAACTQAPAPAGPETGVPATAPSAQITAEPTDAQGVTAPAESSAKAYPSPADGEDAEGGYPGPDAVSESSADPAAYPAASDKDSPQAPLRSADGVLSAGEYAHQVTIGKVTLYWSNDDQFLFLAAEAQTGGWLGIGLNPEDRMKGANYLIAADRDGAAALYDAYGQGAVGATHPEDTQIGGTDDIVASAVVVQDGMTRFEAQIPLESPDQYDGALTAGGTYPVIVATGTSLQFSAPHDYRGVGEITLD